MNKTFSYSEINKIIEIRESNNGLVDVFDLIQMKYPDYVLDHVEKMMGWAKCPLLPCIKISDITEMNIEYLAEKFRNDHKKKVVSGKQQRNFSDKLDRLYTMTTLDGCCLKQHCSCLIDHSKRVEETSIGYSHSGEIVSFSWVNLLSKLSMTASYRTGWKNIDPYILDMIILVSIYSTTA